MTEAFNRENQLTMPRLRANADELMIGETLMATQDIPLIDSAWEWGHVAEFEAFERGYKESVRVSNPIIDHIRGVGSLRSVDLPIAIVHSLLNALPMPALLLDGTYSIAFSNRAARKINIDREKTTGDRFFALFPRHRDARAVQVLIDNVFSNKRSQVYDSRLQVDGRRMWGRMHFRSLRFGASRLVLVVVEDLTAEKREKFLTEKHGIELRNAQNQLEKALEQSTSILLETIAQLKREIAERQGAEEELLKLAKLEATGVLAGGIAHDFNNILTTIQGNISLAKLDAKPQDKQYQWLAEAEKAATRAKDLTEQLLTFSRGGEPVRKVSQIEGMVKDSCEFALRGSNVRCEISNPENIWPVNVDEGQISQVISNLATNAQQSMPQGGVINVKVENHVLRSGCGLPIPAGDYVKISVADQGCGIPQEYLSNVFDPYFTTKQKGSGLGLATAHSIINKHDGLITVDSAPGRGTIFEVYLPRSQAEVVAPYSQEIKPDAGKAKILLMDDEQTILDLSQEMLSMLGYQVDIANEGSAAVELYQKALNTSHPYDLLIVDLVVPQGMGGKEVVEVLGKSDPKIKAIVSSGYSNDPVMANYRQHGFTGVMSKPYTVQQLSEAVSQALVQEVS